MELRYLQSFIRVAQLKSFSKAAKELGYSQAAITIQIQRLEEELETLLFERFNKSISLTRQGELFLLHASEILQASQNAKKAMKEDTTPNGSLRIGTIESLCASIFPSLIADFHSQFPLVNITLITASPQELLKLLEQNKLDIVYFMDQQLYNVNWVKVIEEVEEVVFVCSPRHPIVNKKNLHLKDILACDMILTEHDASYRYELEQYLAKLNISLQPSLEAGNTEFIMQMLCRDYGISFLPKIAVSPYIKKEMLQILHPVDLQFQVWRQMVYHRNKWLTSQMQAFMQMAIK